MKYYTFRNNLILSKTTIYKKDYKEVTEDFAKLHKDKIFIFNPMDPKVSRRSFIVSSKEMCFLNEETLSLLDSSIISNNMDNPLPSWLIDKIEDGRVISLNTNYPNHEDLLTYSRPKKWRVNVVGLGDVGATLLTGLRLLGNDILLSLGIYDVDTNKMDRLKFELSQILSCDGKENSLEILPLKEDELFNCDMFIFCVSVGVPPVGSEQKDVRLIQFEGNRKILKLYGNLARAAQFKGIFAVVSDPVDLLCKSLFEDSNRNEDGALDFMGLAPEQIRGYGLGVMNARAVYYSSLREDTKNYLKEGRAFGPHGEGLIIANSIIDYNEEASNFLTYKTKTANLEVRSAGFKPYIAPALSSGALSILDTLKENYHYSSNFLGGTFMGCKNRFVNGCTENEIISISNTLMEKLEETYSLLDELYNKI